MKTFSKIFFGLVLVLLFISVTNNAPAQGTIECNPGAPLLCICPHPDTDPNLELEGKVTSAHRPTRYIDVHCGQNKYMPVDPCDPWTLEFYVLFWELTYDAVLVSPPNWSWDTTECQDVRIEYVWPTPYVPGTYYDSVVVKVTMITKAKDFCVPVPNYWCQFTPGFWVDTNCFMDCWNERITFMCIDSCVFPSQAICIVEWDKPLPVDLSLFTHSVKDNTVTLNWTTYSEINNSGFYIERKSGDSWINIGFVDGNGNTFNTTNYYFTDKNLNSGMYNYRLKQTDYNGNFEYFDLESIVSIGSPEEFTLLQNYPNPFNPVTTIMYGIPENGNVSMKIFDISGREVKTLVNEPKTAGYYSVKFNASGLSSGVYFYKLEYGNNVVTKKMVLMK